MNTVHLLIKYLHIFAFCCIFAVEKELDYCIRMLEYVMSRITAKHSLKNMLDVCHFRDNFEGVACGRYLNLNCGHNNQYSAEEKMQLCTILTEACDDSSNFA